jgi:hypothetical protein
MIITFFMRFPYVVSTVYYYSSHPPSQFILPPSYNFSHFHSFHHQFHFNLFPPVFPDKISSSPSHLQPAQCDCAVPRRLIRQAEDYDTELEKWVG